MTIKEEVESKDMSLLTYIMKQYNDDMPLLNPRQWERFIEIILCKERAESIKEAIKNKKKKKGDKKKEDEIPFSISLTKMAMQLEQPRTVLMNMPYKAFLDHIEYFEKIFKDGDGEDQPSSKSERRDFKKSLWL